MEQNIRTFKDFLQIYNMLSEQCFKRCVDNLNSRTLDQNEIECVDSCSEKFIKINHRFMAIYVENQQLVVTRRMKEAELAEANIAKNQIVPNDSSKLSDNMEIVPTVSEVPVG
ncbi:hypothetical protein RN001_016221 [Aquatica leii]|uniref:Mitochondrial import inner membrane translocase subunit n=1 Tax=Aquatica leii TaxID=1421715 RepID=A0AAN7NXA9_9COLE|nr:hypothetical protein RN001_016221 [Aquatica leii]